MAENTNGRRDAASLERELTRMRGELDRLRQSQSLLLSTLDAASDGICTLQYADNMFFYNIRFVELWGIPEDRLSDMDVDALLDFQLTQVKDAHGWLTLVQQRQNNPDEEGISIVELKDGRLLERHVLPQRIGGRNVGSVLIFRDITQQRRQEEEIRRARDMAEEATRMKSEFLANMSHEIRTPMNAIIGLSHLALNTSLTPRQRDYIHKVQASGQHLLGIINDILDFSKVEAGKLDLDVAEFELETLLAHTNNLVSERCHAKGLELVFDVGAEVPAVLVGDSLRLGQILLNYANNAVKFTDKGDIVIAVHVKECDDRGALLKFEVSDTGIGLTPEQRDRLFESFAQVDASATRKFGGSGLGLAICKRLAALMGGEVGVDSDFGRGSTFWCTARVGIAADQRRQRVPRPDIRDRRALVVDDNEHARHAIAQMLRGMTFSTAEAADGGAAIEEVVLAAARGQPYDVIYLDWRMPGLDGIEVARRLQGLDLASPPLVLMVTAYGREDTIRKARASGIADVLVKPVSPSMLFDATMDAMGNSRQLARAAPARAAADARLASVRDARVLLVEDNEINQQVARELLQDAGVRVDVADTGRAALVMLGQTPYDLVFMDMQMPEMDGLEATRALRREARFATLPVVAMTANAMEEDRKTCLAAGMNDFLGKPMKPQDLYAVLLRWIPSRSAPAAAVRRQGWDLPEIPALDTALGLENMAGKRGLYLAIIRRFVDSQRGVGEQIRRRLAAADRPGAYRLVHNLKGLAGSIGATGLQAEAHALQQAIHDREPIESLHMRQARLDVALDSLIEGLEAHLGPADGPPQGYGDPALAD